MSALIAVLLAGSVLAAGCQMAPPPGTSHSPSGSLDLVASPAGSFSPIMRCWQQNPAVPVHVRGWASDWDTDAPIQVMLLLFKSDTNIIGTTRWQTWIGPFTADHSRLDVKAALNRGGDLGRVGFDVEFPYGEQPCIDQVCAIALNVGPGDNTILGCKLFTEMAGA
jgi:hypothetical protein